MKDALYKIQLKLRQEKSKNLSGVIYNQSKIPILREKDYLVEEDFRLDGDAPKQFIKAYIYKPRSGIRRKKTTTWIPFIAKSGAKWYPHESVIEYLINRIGQVLGLRMNEIALYRVNGQIRFLSKYFRAKHEMLIHGAEICGDYLEDRAFAHEIANNKQTARELFTFEFLKEAIEGVFGEHAKDILNDLVRILIFDAIVGNNDRHFYNWAVVRSTIKKNAVPALAPVYDSSRGLFWNFDEEKVCAYYQNMNNPSYKKLTKYLKKACPRISIEEDKEVNHFKLISYLVSYNNRYRQIVSELSSLLKEDAVLNMFRIEFEPLFSIERYKLTEFVIKERFRIIRENL